MIELLEQEERPAYVRFERKAMENKAESLKEGKAVYQDVDWIFVTPPYSRDVFEDKADNWLKKQRELARRGRIPQKFIDLWDKAYENWKIGQEAPIDGTDVRNWAAVSPADIKRMQAVGIRTIEDMAKCNAEGLGRLGMGAQKLKDKAVAYLSGSGDLGKLVMEVAELKKQLETAEIDNQTLRDQVRTLKYQLENRESNVESFEPQETITASDLIDEPELIKDELGHYRGLYREKFGRKARFDMTLESIKAKVEE